MRTVDLPPRGLLVSPLLSVGPWLSLVERLLGVQEVASSNLAGPTSYLRPVRVFHPGRPELFRTARVERAEFTPAAWGGGRRGWSRRRQRPQGQGGGSRRRTSRRPDQLFKAGPGVSPGPACTV